MATAANGPHSKQRLASNMLIIKILTFTYHYDTPNYPILHSQAELDMNLTSHIGKMGYCLLETQ